VESGFSRIVRNAPLEELAPTFLSSVAPLGGTFAPKKLTSGEVDINIDEMPRTNHISLARVAANGAAPPGAQA
jgi:hypothetical protein